MAHSVDIVEGVDGLGGAGGEGVEHEGHGGVVVGHGGVVHHFVLIDAVLVEGFFGPDALADSLGEHFLGLNIDELVLQRRGTGIQDEDVQ